MLNNTCRRILVVDDLADAAHSYALLLELWGYETRVCCNAAAVLEVACEYQPHVVLLDIGMPRVDGFEVSRRLRARPEFAHTVIIASTGYTADSDRRHAHLAGFDHYLIKPIDPDCLQQLLARVAPLQSATPGAPDFLTRNSVRGGEHRSTVAITADPLLVLLN